MKQTLSVIVTTAVFLLSGLTVSALEYVKVEGTTVTLTCPEEADSGSWYKEESKDKRSNVLAEGNTYTIVDYTDSKDGRYYCGAKSQLYIKIKVCENCIDLSTQNVIGIICGDLLLTVLVAVSVYCFAKRQGKGSKDFRSPSFDDFSPSRASNVASPAQNTDYAPIKGGQRDVYDKLQRKY